MNKMLMIGLIENFDNLKQSHKLLHTQIKSLKLEVQEIKHNQN